MRKTKEVLRLKFELGLGQRQIARSCGMDHRGLRVCDWKFPQKSLNGLFSHVDARRRFVSAEFHRCGFVNADPIPAVVVQPIS